MEMSETSKKARYNLNLVVQETGLKPDVLRAWEKRYQLPQPGRSAGGHRLYSDFDILVIKWLQSRMKDGMRISQAAAYWKELVSRGDNPFDLAAEKAPSPASNLSDQGPNQTLIDLKNSWIKHCLNFDEQQAELVLTQAFAQFPAEIVTARLIASSLTEIGELWYDGKATVQQEHFASELAVRKIQTLVSTAPRPIHTEMILISSPAGEQHSVPTLILNLLLRFRGWETLYLGTNVPLQHMEETVRDTKPSLAVFSATRLPAALSMLRSIQLLNHLQVPSGFGGEIFSRVPSLTEHIPAHYLGSEISQAIDLIEELIANPTIKQVDNNYSTLEPINDLFQVKRNLIEDQVIEHFSDNKYTDILDDIREANKFLADEISAGFSFGDLNLINSDLAWLEGLLRNRVVFPGVYDIYINQYATSVRTNLGSKGNIIAEWLLTQIK